LDRSAPRGSAAGVRYNLDAALMTSPFVHPTAGPATAVAPRSLRVLLLQVRDHRAAELHEQRCFLDRLGLAPERLTSVNVAAEPVPAVGGAARADLVVLGGAGAHSAYLDYPFTERLLELVRELVERDRPFFGSCFGHQFLGRAMGGTVVHDAVNEEVGTFDVELTEAGRRDPLFAGLPESFPVHLGHHDRIDRVPDGVVTLAASARCAQQVIRVTGRPAYGSQFHCEMTDRDMRERVLMYASEYLAGEDPVGELSRRLRPTPVADGLLARFVAELG
jgi:GMP synthase (glutamine-hydrolysing)